MLDVRCNFGQRDWVVLQFEIPPNPVVVGKMRHAGLLQVQPQNGFLWAVGILHARIALRAIGENDMQANRPRIRSEIQEREVFLESGNKLFCCFARKRIETIEVVRFVLCCFHAKQNLHRWLRRRLLRSQVRRPRQTRSNDNMQEDNPADYSAAGHEGTSFGGKAFGEDSATRGTSISGSVRSRTRALAIIAFPPLITRASSTMCGLRSRGGCSSV